MKWKATVGAAGVAWAVLACAGEPVEPLPPVRVDASVTPAVVGVQGEVMVEVTATNEGASVAHWTSGCGMDLDYSVFDSAGTLVPGTGPSLCTLELRSLSLEPGAAMKRRVRWPLRGGVQPGLYRVQGRLGFLGPTPRRGTRAMLRVIP